MHRRRHRTDEIIWATILALVGCLLACLIASQTFRFQIGGKWSVPLVGIAFLIVMYLQPAAQRVVKHWVELRRDQAEKRWWAEREKRERAALIKSESMRQGKTHRNL